MEVALDAGAEDIITDEDGSIEVLTAPEEYQAVKDALESAELQAEDSDVTMRPQTSIELDEEGFDSVQRLIDVLDDLDDVQNVYSNAELKA